MIISLAWIIAVVSTIGVGFLIVDCFWFLGREYLIFEDTIGYGTGTLLLLKHLMHKFKRTITHYYHILCVSLKRRKHWLRLRKK